MERLWHFHISCYPLGRQRSVGKTSLNANTPEPKLYTWVWQSQHSNCAAQSSLDRMVRTAGTCPEGWRWNVGLTIPMAPLLHILHCFCWALFHTSPHSKTRFAWTKGGTSWQRIHGFPKEDPCKYDRFGRLRTLRHMIFLRWLLWQLRPIKAAVMSWGLVG